MILGVIIGATAMIVLSHVPVLDFILAGFIAGLIARGTKRGILLQLTTGFQAKNLGGLEKSPKSHGERDKNETTQIAYQIWNDSHRRLVVSCKRV